MQTVYVGSKLNGTISGLATTSDDNVHIDIVLDGSAYVSKEAAWEFIVRVCKHPSVLMLSINGTVKITEVYSSPDYYDTRFVSCISFRARGLRQDGFNGPKKDVIRDRTDRLLEAIHTIVAGL